MLSFILLCISVLSVESGQNAPYLSIADEKAGFDSLNMTFVGNWPFGSTSCVAIDSTRNVVFLGSGGGIIVLNVQDPSNPQKIGEIRTRSYVGVFSTPTRNCCRL